MFLHPTLQKRKIGKSDENPSGRCGIETDRHFDTRILSNFAIGNKIT